MNFEYPGEAFVKSRYPKALCYGDIDGCVWIAEEDGYENRISGTFDSAREAWEDAYNDIIDYELTTM